MNITYDEISKNLEAYAAEFDMKFSKKQIHLMCSFAEWLLSQHLEFKKAIKENITDETN